MSFGILKKNFFLEFSDFLENFRGDFCIFLIYSKVDKYFEKRKIRSWKFFFKNQEVNEKLAENSKKFQLFFFTVLHFFLVLIHHFFEIFSFFLLTSKNQKKLFFQCFIAFQREVSSCFNVPASLLIGKRKKKKIFRASKSS